MESDPKQSIKDLWFKFGNRGKRHTNGNHKFIQRIVEVIESGKNPTKEWYTTHKKTYKKLFEADLTKECIEAIEEQLKKIIPNLCP